MISVSAGKGGAGARHFRREKFVPRGGPDGGNGGKGGSVILRADANKHTLVDFSFRPEWRAEDGAAGGGSLKDGRAAEDLIVLVPVGTQIYRHPDGELAGDLSADKQELVVAKGGRGGKGNAFFKSATNQTPEHAQPGEEGESGKFRLSLKLVADVGLIGFPNAGKSTLISRISAARPKIADYPFTTLEPNLGVARTPSGRSFVVADIPGLIPGAHLGKGLGIKFLKHIERTKILVHLLDPSGTEEANLSSKLIECYDAIREELKGFSAELSQKRELVYVNKIDLFADQGWCKEVLTQFETRGVQVEFISAVSGRGIEQLLRRIAQELGNLERHEAGDKELE